MGQDEDFHKHRGRRMDRRKFRDPTGRANRARGCYRSWVSNHQGCSRSFRFCWGAGQVYPPPHTLCSRALAPYERLASRTACARIFWPTIERAAETALQRIVVTALRSWILAVDTSHTVIYFPQPSIREWIMEWSTPRRILSEMRCAFRSKITRWRSYLQTRLSST